MRFSMVIRVYNVMVSLSLAGNYVEGKFRLTQVPPSILYASDGGTARFIWDYYVDNRTEEFQISSPKWIFYFLNDTSVDIGYEHFLTNWKWVIVDTCPSRLLNPTRVSKESNATLVIYNVTTADNGVYAIALMPKNHEPIISKVQLIVTTRPKFNTVFHENRSIPEGKDLRINCSATGIPTPNITWVFLNGETEIIESQGVSSAELFIQNITRNQSGTYQCQATNNLNVVPLKHRTKVIIWYKPNVLFANWTAQGNAIFLRCIVSGEPNPVITWYDTKGNQVISGINEINGGSQLVLEIPDTNTDIYGLYKCNATNEVGSQVRFFNITRIHYPTMSTMRTLTGKVVVATSMINKAGNSDGEDNAHLKLNLHLILFIVSGVIIVVLIIMVIMLRKYCRQIKTDKNEHEVSEANENTRLPDVVPKTQVTANYDEVGNMPVYAQIDVSKTLKNRHIDYMPIYAQIDKTKKRRAGQIIYAELEDLKPNAESMCGIIPASYTSTEYADIKNIQNRPSVINSEPIYETLPDI